MTPDESISHAWRDAAADLGIRVHAPYRVALRIGVADVELFLPDFGSATGAFVISKHNRAHEVELRAGHWCSVLGDTYRIYDRDLFRETLDDWGWYGKPGEAPSWYTGKHWS